VAQALLLFTWTLFFTSSSLIRWLQQAYLMAISAAAAVSSCQSTSPKCAKCQIARYCGSECQLAAWPYHRYCCNVLKAKGGAQH
jgi:radical SAM protein with 4Fe4S-binding SPASM domain